MQIKILGSGCPSCKSLYENVLSIVGENKDIAVEYITDVTAILEAGVMGSPALVIDNIAVSVGRVPSVEEIEGYIEARKDFKDTNNSGCSCSSGCCQ